MYAGGDPVDDCARREAGLADALRQALAPPGAMPWPRAALLADRSPRAVSRQPLAAKKLFFFKAKCSKWFKCKIRRVYPTTSL